MRKRLKIACVVALAVLPLFAAPAPGALKGTREERVRKFQNSLGQEVVRDREKPPSSGNGDALYLYIALWLGGAVACLAAAQFLLHRFRARRQERETVSRYLTENLMTPAAVREHTERVVADRIPLYVWIDDHFIKFSSRAETIDPDEDVLVVLPLSPAVGNDMLRSSTRVRIEYMYQKVPYHYECRWRNERTDRGTFFHLLSLPEKIDFTQRREVYRVDPPLSAPVVCRTPDQDRPDLSVLDIGMGGFSVGSSSRFRPGEELATCRLEGEALLPVDASARCVYEQEVAEGKAVHRWRHGFRFTRFGEGSERRLAQYIARQQGADLSRRREMEI